MLEPFTLPFVQRGVVEILILSVAAGLLGTWIVLRGLAFYSHAVGTSAFPGLVLADGLGFAAPLGALAAAGAFSAGAFGLGRLRRSSDDSATAIILVGALAAGVILASDVFASGSNIEQLLFGSLLLIDSGDLLLAGLASGLALAGTIVLGRFWLTRGFDFGSAQALGAGSVWPDIALLGLIAVAAIAALTTVGALLIGSLFVVPAATARLLTRRVLTLQVLSCTLAGVEGVAGIWLSVKTDAPPGATIAVLSGVVFALAIGVRWLAARPRLRGVALAGAGAALVIGGCGGGDGGDGRVTVIATTTQVADLVREVGGDSIEVGQIIEPNSDPHDYEPRPSDVEAAAGADVVFRSGGDLDDWSEELLSDSGSDAELIDLSEAVPIEITLDGEVDPHWWHDPRNARAASAEIRRALAGADPANARTYAANHERFSGQVTRLDRRLAACVSSVPEKERKLVTDHDSFAYLASRYGLEVVGAVVPSLTTAAQASAGELADLAEQIRDDDVRAIFPEASTDGRLAEAISRETGASAEYELYGDSLGPEGSGAETYLAMEEANVDAIVRGLTGGRVTCEVGGLE